MTSVMCVAVASAVSRRILRLSMVYMEERPSDCELRALHWDRYFPPAKLSQA